MQKTTKAIFLGVAMFAIVGTIGFTTSAMAAPQPLPGKDKVYQFNMIARPNNYDGSCGEGNRIFVNADDSSSRIRVTDDPITNQWNILDCNAIDDRMAVLEVETGIYAVYAVAHGKPQTGIDICATWESDYEGDGSLCNVGTFDIKRIGGQS